MQGFDPDRVIRFILPPFVLLGSLLIELILIDGIDHFLCTIKQFGSSSVAIVIIGAGGVYAAGYVLSVITIFILRVFFLARGGRHFEPTFDDQTVNRILTQLQITRHNYESFLRESVNNNPNRSRWSATIPFHHMLLPDSMRNWFIRRWTHFIALWNCGLALVFAMAIGSILYGKPTLETGIHTWWLVGNLFLLFVMLGNAWFIYQEVSDVSLLLSFSRKIDGAK